MHIINPDLTFPGNFAPGKKVEKKESRLSDFEEFFKNALAAINRQQLKADESISGFLAGEIEDIHQVMIATEQARLSLQLTVQVTNKFIEAYKDISRMQV